MKWTNEPGEPFQVLAFNQDEVKILVEILKGRVRKEVASKYKKYKDIHEGGEATERQCTLMFKYEEQLNLIDKIIEV
jgi:hypothetical protein